MKTVETKAFQSLCYCPGRRKIVVERKELRDLLFESEGYMFFGRKRYEIMNKHLGAGAYRVWLSEAEEVTE